MSQESRRGEHQRAPRIDFGNGVPLRSEGRNGEMRFNLTTVGPRLFIKFNGEWFSFRPELSLSPIMDITLTASAGFHTQTKTAIHGILTVLRIAGIIDKRSIQ
jgi:hypothetical protein